MDSTRTISEMKSRFIRRQIRLFSESLSLPENWRKYARPIDEDDLGEKAIEDVLQKVNAAAKQHNRIVYSSQAIHHIAHQIASLYWSSVTQEGNDRANFGKGVEKTADLSKHLNIINLPMDIEHQNASVGQNTRYQDLRERLASLDQERQKRRQRLHQIEYLQHLLEPFKNPQQDIQPNLVTRDGELVQELEKMRMLVARVGGRIAQHKIASSVQVGREYLLPGSDQRLEALLDADI